MGRKSNHINLTADQKTVLEQEYKTGATHDYRNRCHCILLNSEGWSSKKLKAFFSVSLQTIYSWQKRYKAEGIQGLRIRSGRGRKRKLDIDNSTHVKAVKAGLAKENRSVKQIRESLESQLGLTIGETTLRDFLKDLVTDTGVSDSVSNPSKTQGRWVKK